MRQANQAVDTDGETTDHDALRLMLSYVEAECLRIGAMDAAKHAALAASLMPDGMAVKPARARGLRLH
ncbi:MAG: hypothetical protein IRY87_03070 [Acetobacteraceae bacterium]|mgnify:CR=1 FL=1|nr:hypothetical protein [Acetobacteraceae bacterium]